MFPDRPLARSEGLVSEELETQVLLYDTESHLAHALEGEAAGVWRACDGHADVQTLALRCATTEDEVRATLGRLDELGLLERGGETRRSALVKMTAAGVGLGAGIPTIASIVVPTAAAANSAQGCTREVVEKANAQGGRDPLVLLQRHHRRTEHGRGPRPLQVRDRSRLATRRRGQCVLP